MPQQIFLKCGDTIFVRNVRGEIIENCIETDGSIVEVNRFKSII